MMPGMYSTLQLREVFHFCFLERLLRMADSSLFVLKGGVNLRFFFHSPRYSEDMDLDVLAGSVGTLRKNGYKLLADASFRRTLQVYGIADIEINDPDKTKHTQTTQRFRVRLLTASGERLPTKVEFSRRAGAGKSTDSSQSVEQIDVEIARRYKRLSFSCQHYSGEAAAVQKVLALAGRTLTQARDVFDLDILQRGGYGRAELIAEHVASTDRDAALQKLQSLSFEDFSGQVLEFLDEEHRSQYETPSAWKAMVSQVSKLLVPR